MRPDLSAYNMEFVQLEVGNQLQNYIYLLHDNTHQLTACVDPTESDLVLEALEKRGWKLDIILTTHHHHDHVGGIPALKAATNCHVLGFEGDRSRIPLIDIGIEEREHITFGSQQAEILFIPGHTLGHIAYYFKEMALLFCGDTLFAMGCGRMFEGTAGQFKESFDKILKLPDNSWLCCAHEYSQTNAAFALTVEPHNKALQERAKLVQAQRANNEFTVPSQLAEEKATNPFLRSFSQEIRENLALHDATDTEVIAALRRLKDTF